MARFFLVFGSIAGFLGVAFGAFAAHGLKSRLSPELMGVFEVGVRYHMYHALAILLAGWAYGQWSHPGFVWAGRAFMGGLVIFSGSLYVLSVSGVKAWGMVTPLGGLLLLAGWLCLAWAFFQTA